jgi:hypothetical protein
VHGLFARGFCDRTALALILQVWCVTRLVVVVAEAESGCRQAPAGAANT